MIIFFSQSWFYLIDWLILIRQSMSREEGILVGFILLLWMLTLTIFFQRWGRSAVCRIPISLEWIPIQKGYESAIIDGGSWHPLSFTFFQILHYHDAPRHLCGHGVHCQWAEHSGAVVRVAIKNLVLIASYWKNVFSSIFTLMGWGIYEWRKI